MQYKLPPLIVIVGPTATGKSSLAIQLALSFRGEVVNADSRVVYRGMDIGTAKPSPEERTRIPHHLVDLIEPDGDFNLASYLDLAHRAIRAIHQRGRVPFLVGGTGLYVWGLLEGLRAPHVPPNPQLRRSLEQRARDEGAAALHHHLRRMDPLAASRIDPRNIRRVVRSLEVCLETGMPFSSLRRREPPPYRALVLGLTTQRAELYCRIDQRVDAMIEGGWPQEVCNLLRRGYAPEIPSMSSLGYRDMAAYIRGEVSLEEVRRRIKTATHRFARRQYAWFRPGDPRIHWLELGPELLHSAEEGVKEFLNSC